MSTQGGKLYNPPPKLKELCSPLTPIQFHTLWSTVPPIDAADRFQLHPLARSCQLVALISCIMVTQSCHRGEGEGDMEISKGREGEGVLWRAAIRSHECCLLQATEPAWSLDSVDGS